MSDPSRRRRVAVGRFYFYSVGSCRPAAACARRAFPPNFVVLYLWQYQICNMYNYIAVNL
jgi:hypothetical protein